MAGKKDTDLQKIASKIKKMRIDAGFKSYESFANAKDIDIKQYWRVENRSNLTLRTLIKVLKLHKITLKEFFSDLD